MAYQEQQGGLINACIGKILKYVDEPSTQTKYTPIDMLDLMAQSFTEEMIDLQNNGNVIPVATTTVTLVAGQKAYQLPACVGEVIRVQWLDTDGTSLGTFRPRSYFNPLGPGWRMEGRTRLIIDPAPTAAATLEVQYHPSGEALLHAGSVPCSKVSSNSITLSQTVSSQGYLDQRPYAYKGCILNIYRVTNPQVTADLQVPGYVRWPIQTRLVTGCTPSTLTLTVDDFDVDISDLVGVAHYELYPVEFSLVWPVIAYSTAIKILTIEKKKEAVFLTERLYAKALRAMVLKFANVDNRLHFETDTEDNPETGTYW